MSKKHLIQKLQFVQLRTRLADQIAHFHPGLRKTLLNNLSELVAAITLAHSVQLATIGAKLPVDTDQESREQWVRRQLSNQTQGTLALFRPLAESLLAGFVGRSIRVILDPTDLAEDLTIVQLAVAYRGRALPLAWMTVAIQPGSVQAAIRSLFAELQTWLPAETRVYLIGDREFHGEDMLELIQAQGWIPVVRTKGNLIIEQDDGTRTHVADLAPQPGQRAFYQHVFLTDWGWGPYSLSVASAAPAQRGAKGEDPWFIVSTEPAGPVILNLYGVRMWADEMFRDLKSHGFHLEQTRLERPERLDRLMLALALAYWWAIGRGIWVDRLHLRDRVDREDDPGCSLFTLGLRWICRQLELDRLPDVVLVPIL